jgi:hypothetical protein
MANVLEWDQLQKYMEVLSKTVKDPIVLEALDGYKKQLFPKTIKGRQLPYVQLALKPRPWPPVSGGVCLAGYIELRVTVANLKKMLDNLKVAEPTNRRMKNAMEKIRIDFE